jgi:hypothetical protein
MIHIWFTNNTLITWALTVYVYKIRIIKSKVIQLYTNNVNKLKPHAALFNVRNVRIETACSAVSQGFVSSVYIIFIKYRNFFNSNSSILMYWPNYSQLFAKYLHSPRGLRSGSVASRLLELCVRILPGAWRLSVVIVVCCKVCDELITRPEE